MFTWFNNLKIRNKLILAFLVIITLFFMANMIALLGQNKIQATLTELFEVDSQIATLGRQSQNAMLIAQRNEKNYFLNYKKLGFEVARSKYVAQMQTDIFSIHKYMEEIRILETEAKHITETSLVKQTIAEYETTFLAVINLLEKRGFKDSGLEGLFRDSVHAIEEAVKIRQLDQLTIDMLTLRRHEKDYLLRADETYVTHLHETVTQFKANVITTDLNPAEKEQLIALANEYQTHFDDLVQIDTQIATRMENYQTAVHHLEPLLKDISNTAQLHEQRAQTNIQNITQTVKLTVLIAIVVVMILGLSLAFWLANIISKPLTTIVKSAQLLMAGNTTLSGIHHTEIETIIARQDEMGDIGRAFDNLAHYFKTVIGDIVQVSQGLAAGNLSITPQSEYRGDFMQIKTALESALSNQRLVIQDIVQVSQGLAEGKLSVAPQLDYQGDFVQIKIALEAALSNQRQVIEDIVYVSQGLAEGNLNVAPQLEYQGDFLNIRKAQETALSNQRQVIEDIVGVSQGLAKGLLQVQSQATYQGDFVRIKTALEAALTNLREVVKDIVHVSQSLADGELNITPLAEYRGDFVQIKTALETAALKLAKATTQNANQDWLKTGHAQLNDLISGEQTIDTLAKKIISFLTTYSHGHVGLFYRLQDIEADKKKPFLQMIASYAYTNNDNRPQTFLLGEGLVGQAALEQKPLAITQTPEECHPIVRSGLTNALPRHVLLLPFLYENTVKGIIEIGSHETPTTIQQDFLEQTLSSIGIAVNTAESRTRMRQLLEQSQRQTEELQMQSEELQAQQEEMQQINEELQSQREELEHKQAELQHRNEELQSQSEEVQSQSEELQTQQEELKQTNEALEERTKDLEQQKANIQQKNLALEKTQVEMKKTQVALETKARELELASRYKSEFLANMSHELRTPLNSLLILAQLLTENRAGNLTDKQVEYAKTIHSAGSDLLTLINEILDLSKVEAGRIEVHAEAVSFTDLVEMIEQKFRHVAAEQKLEFQITVANDLPPILHTDRQRLKQILNNLLSNAFKFTSQGAVKLDIQFLGENTPGYSQQEGVRGRTTPGDFQPDGIKGREKSQIAFSVTDTGIGIPTDKQETVFEAFQQVDGSTSRRYGGTGLGLSISRQLARLLGGDILLHSEADKGSTFTLYISEKIERHSSNDNRDIPETQIQNTPALLSPIIKTPTLDTLTIPSTPMKALEPLPDDRDKIQPSDKVLLIVEDDRKFSTLILELARETGFKCLVAEDGITGLQMAEQYKPHAIILDVGLPNLDGWKVMEQLKNNPDTRHIPVHFISAFDQSLEAKKMGAIGYLMKPVNMEQLGETFQKIEYFMTNKVKNVLIVVDNETHQQQILSLVSGENIQTSLAVTTITALQHIKETLFDCVILDMDIEQHAGGQLLEHMQAIGGLCQVPVIVYTERDLTAEEEALLMRCADDLPLKSVSSPERLLDETTLFLHQVEANLPKDKRNMLRMVHDKEAILAGKKVLIVDDDPRNTFALATILEDKNMEVIAGENGHEALELLEQHEDIAIVLMDIMMPEMDGYEAMRQIRAQKNRFRRQLPIIALTAKAMKGDKTKCIEAGANDYLSKPVDTDKLISLMRVWLYR
ncbi:Response regulator receiver [Beggiatoa sp. PS]|nr:Response regulator receiver [Beggiatoa sp. PS]